MTFAIEPIKGNWNLFRNFIFDRICSRDYQKGMQLLSWMFLSILEGSKSDAAIILRGSEATGKTTFSSLFGKLFGDSYLSLDGNALSNLRFNSCLENTRLLSIKDWCSNKSCENVVKALVSENHILIEEKGKDVKVLRNFINLIIETNSTWNSPRGIYEKRFHVFNLSNAQEGDVEYFYNIHFQMRDNGGCSAMLYDLLQFN